MRARPSASHKRWESAAIPREVFAWWGRQDSACTGAVFDSGGAVPRQPRRISSLRMCGWGLLTRAAETCRCRACRGAHHTALHVSACQSMTCRIYALQCIPHADADSRRGWVPLARSPPKTAMPRGVATHVCPERAAGRHEPSST